LVVGRLGAGSLGVRCLRPGSLGVRSLGASGRLLTRGIGRNGALQRGDRIVQFGGLACGPVDEPCGIIEILGCG
jgi:hypothetical protein